MAKGQEWLLQNQRAGPAEGRPLMGTPGLPQGQASPAARTVRGRGWGRKRAGLGTQVAEALEMGETQRQVDDGLQQTTGNMEPTPPAQVGKRRG